MQYKIPYKIPRKYTPPALGSAALDGEIGARYDRFAFERISGPFAVREILREAEECLRDKYDDEFCQGLWRCEFWGKQILSAVRVCQNKQDSALREEIRRSVYRVLAWQDADGYLGSYKDSENIFPPSVEECIRTTGEDFPYNWNVWGQKYTLWAMLEAAQLLNDTHVLTCCERMADRMIAQLTRMGLHVTDAGSMHGMAAGSILKPMLVLYRLTGKKAYLELCLDTAAQWERADGARPNLITNALSGKSPAFWYSDDGSTGNNWVVKAYEMMSCYDGLIELYRVTGEKKYLSAVENFWAALKRDEANILGSVGYCERFALAARYPDSATEVCDVIHWMRLSHELFCLTGESKYMDAFELAFMNAFLAGIYEDGKNGAFFVRSSGRQWTAESQVDSKYQHCCLNNAARGFTNAAESAVMRTADGYAVNLYVQSRVSFESTSLRISSGYADKGRISITVRGAQAGEKLYLRIPNWSSSTTITLDGKAMDAGVGGSVYTHTLSGADEWICLQFDMTPEIIEFTQPFPTPAAEDYHVFRWQDERGLCDRQYMMPHPMAVLRRGPVMLARSKRLDQADTLFDGNTVCGTDCTCTASDLRHDRMLCACRVTLQSAAKTHTYLMCDYASAANRDVEDPGFFTMYI